MNSYPSEPCCFGLIIGAMKCGTTSLFKSLAQHPEVAPCRKKEPQYFSCADPQAIRLDEYRRLWSWDPRRHKIAVEASTNYSKIPAFPDVAERLAQIRGVSFRFVYLMRNPLERLESQVHHGLARGWGGDLDKDGIAPALASSFYAAQLDAYARYFPRESLLPLVFEDYCRAPAGTLARVCRFFDIDPMFSFTKPEHMRNRASTFSLAHPLIRAMAKIASASAIAETPLGKRIQRGLIHRLPIHGRATLNEAERREALARLAPDLVRLRDVYGIDAAEHWGITIPSPATAARIAANTFSV